VLLRLDSDLSRLRFDAVALLDTDNRGVRELVSDHGHLWAVLGPAPPSHDRSCLWRARIDDIVPGAMIPGEVVAADLPPGSEGMVIDGSSAIILVDGAEGPTESEPCDDPARQLRLELRIP
jgi:hypothetical protein